MPLKAITAEKKATVERHSGLLTGGRKVQRNV